LELGLITLKNDEDLAKCVELGNVEHNDDSDNDLDDVFIYDNENEESETASVDHLSDGEEEVYDARTRKPDIAPKKCDHCPIHDPTIKWKLMRHVLGEKYESPEQLERALVFYALANGYKLYYEVNNPRRLLAKCCRDEKDRKCPFRLWASWMQNEKTFHIKKLINEHACSKTYEYGTLITSNWIAKNYAKKR
ncbi:reverse transcriptase domain-containing protein, partial [Tanacetum coccineum]